MPHINYPPLGTRFGRFKIIGDRISKGGRAAFPCLCDCGNIRIVLIFTLRSGRSSSCGCFRSEHPTNLIHGDSHTRLHQIWCGIRQRCNDKNAKLFKHYGGRGIQICHEWNSDYRIFKDWALSHGYASHLVIDRIYTYGNYEPSNCRWVTQKENSRNASNNHKVAAFGEIKCIGEWAEDPRCKVKYGTLWKRIDDGLTPEVAITAALTKSKLKAKDVVNIRQRLSKDESCASIARAYGLSPTTIISIKHNHTWRA